MAVAKLPQVPASLFGVVLGLAGLGGSWRLAHRLWGLPAVIGEVLILAAALVWVILMVLYAARFHHSRSEAVAELHHPIQCCFVGLVGVATMLVALGVLPYSRPLAMLLFLAGAGFALVFALWRTGHLWRGARETAHTTAILYLPTVAASFVAATTAAELGLPEWGSLFFGAGFFSWLAIESVLLHRLYTGPVMAAALRPTLGIQLAPPVVGAVAYLAVTPGLPTTFVHAMLGYGLLQALLLLRLVGWLREQPFGPSYWAFTFGATALAETPLIMIAHGDHGAVDTLAPILFVGANLLVGAIAIGTIRLMLQGKLLPKPPPVVRDGVA